MKLLLDSHVLVWAHDQPASLSSNAKAAIKNSSNEIFLSVASVWELQIKIKLGKLTLSDSLENVVHLQQQRNGLQILSLNLPHVLELDNLPLHHKDPFDRILICQAIAANLTIVSADKKFATYGVSTIW